MAAKKKPEEATKQATVRVDGLAGEYRFFNAFSVGHLGEMIHIRFFFNSPGRVPALLLDAVSTQEDCNQTIANLKAYIGKIGAPSAEKIEEPEYPPISAPVMFQHMGVLSRGSMGELTIAQFSHLSALEAGKTGAEIEAKIHGIYVSDIGVHKRFIYEYVGLVTSGK